jgi:nicotinate phosphoribosyltransferase
LPQAVDYLLNLGFTAEEIDYLRGLPQFARAPASSSITSAAFVSRAIYSPCRKGTPLFAGEPLLTVRAPIVEAQCRKRTCWPR